MLCLTFLALENLHQSNDKEDHIDLEKKGGTGRELTDAVVCIVEYIMPCNSMYNHY